MAEIIYVWTGTELTARVTMDNPTVLDLPVEIHMSIATKVERVEQVVVPALGSLTVDFPGYTFTEAGSYPAACYINEPGMPTNVYASMVADPSLEVIEPQLVATVDWV